MVAAALSNVSFLQAVEARIAYAPSANSSGLLDPVLGRRRRRVMTYTTFALIGIVPAFFLGAKVLSYLISLYQGRRFAESSPIPCVTIYNPRDSFTFWFFSPWLSPVIERLPWGWGRWIHYAKKDFSWASKGILHREELGSDVFWTVGYGGGNLWVSDADVISQITHRWKDFPKPIDSYVWLQLFGPNVVSTEGATWQRHRKITGPPFNDRNSNLVFQETLTQAKAMLASFTHDVEGNPCAPGHEPVVENLIHWMMAVTLNVLTGAAFNLQMPWPTRSIAAENFSSTTTRKIEKEEPTDSIFSSTHTMDFQTAVDIVMNHSPMILLLPPWLMRFSPLRLLRDVQRASDEFVKYMHEIIASHELHSNLSSSDFVTGKEHKPTLPSAGDLLSSIVKAGSLDKSNALSQNEIVGNIVIFILAGHETSATTLQTGLILLAANPQLQQDIQDEIAYIWATKNDDEDLTYEDYPKMRVIMALMLETLRLFPPVVTLPKSTTADQPIIYRGESIIIPANNMVSVDIVSVQRNPIYWGSDSQEFRPSRWLMPSSYVAPPNSLNESAAHAHLLCPHKSSFLAFSGGFRACLGKKFAQVEFCILIAVLLKDYSVELVGDKGVTWEETRTKALDDLDDRTTGLAMRMRKIVKVRFVKRGAETSPIWL